MEARRCTRTPGFQQEQDQAVRTAFAPQPEPVNPGAGVISTAVMRGTFAPLHPLRATSRKPARKRVGMTAAMVLKPTTDFEGTRQERPMPGSHQAGGGRGRLDTDGGTPRTSDKMQTKHAVLRGSLGTGHHQGPCWAPIDEMITAIATAPPPGTHMSRAASLNRATEFTSSRRGTRRPHGPA